MKESVSYKKRCGKENGKQTFRRIGSPIAFYELPFSKARQCLSKTLSASRFGKAIW